jgi:hypothetical protein
MLSLLFLFTVEFKYVNIAVIQTYYCKMSMYQYKGTLHNMLIHTAVHLVLLNSAPYNYSQNSFISLYLYASLKNDCILW